MHNRKITQTMKRTLIALTLFASLQLVSAQERLPREEALRYSSAVTTASKNLTGLPLTTDVDAQQPVALRDGDYGCMVLPQKNLTASTLAQAGKESITPIGQLWFHKLTPMRDGAAVSSEKLRLVTVQAEGDEATVPLCALGVRRKTDGALELLVLGKTKEPLVAAPLKTIEAKQEPPIDLAAERDYDSGRITVKLLGKYQAAFQVTELEL
jgi:hypothetical protein